MQYHDPEILGKTIVEKAKAAQLVQDAVGSPLKPPKDENNVLAIKANAGAEGVHEEVKLDAEGKQT